MKKNKSIISGITFSFFILIFVLFTIIALLMLFLVINGSDHRRLEPVDIVLFISGIMGAGLLLFIVFSRTIIAHYHKPLTDLIHNVQAISVEHPEPVRVQGIAEIADIAGAINQVITSQNHIIQCSQRSILHIARELKLISSNMLHQLERFQDNYDTVRSNNARDFSQIIEPLHYIQGITDDLLFLDMLSSRSEKINKEQFNVYNIIEAIKQNHSKSARIKNIAIENSLSPGFTIHSDKKLITMIMDHLLSNAVEYSVTDCNIAINCIITGGKVKLSVTNKVIDLDNDDVMFLFDPFWQKEKYRDPVREHNGLGLAITRAAARLLEININAEFINNKYLMVAIEWSLL